MNCKEIIIDYLEKNGYDGLLNQEGPCGCPKNDLFPCEGDFKECQPAYKKITDCRKCKNHCDAFDEDNTTCFTLNIPPTGVNK